MSNLRRLGNKVLVPIKPDADGYLGRECPEPNCLGYFKVTPGTGVKGPARCHCPYCGYTGDNTRFYTREQIEYARSVAGHMVTEAILKDFKRLEFEHRPRGPFGIGISMKVHGRPAPIRYYREKRLETEVLCHSCGLRYAIYGVFAYCPDCGVHNSLQIFNKNLELTEKQVDLAGALESALAEHLIGDALENVVSAFDGFGRALCSAFPATDTKVERVSFQSLDRARTRVKQLFSVDFASGLTEDQWELTVCGFQKRHLLAHKMGVIDEAYCNTAHDRTAIVGRKVTVSADEVRRLIGVVHNMGHALYAGIPARKGEASENPR